MTEVHEPSPEQEALRELTRARSAAKEDEKRAKHQVSKFLLRQDRRFGPGKRAWTEHHRRWLQGQRFEEPLLQATFDARLRTLEHATERLRELEALLESTSTSREGVREPVALLKCFKGIQTTAAMVLVSELFDIERFSSAPKLMSYLGLTASEHSSGGRHRRGAITKAGNGRLRKLLTEISWTCTRSANTSLAIRKRREGQPAWAVDLAEKAQRRMYRRYRRLVEKGKHKNVAVIAIAREFVGFIWAMLTHHRLLLEDSHAAA